LKTTLTKDEVAALRGYGATLPEMSTGDVGPEAEAATP
jgi:hypothetical protein